MRYRTSVPKGKPYKNKYSNDTVLSLIKNNVQQVPHKIAIKHNSSKITYEELDSRSDKIANFFLNNNFKPGEIIAVAMDRSIAMSLCLLGLMKAGITYLPVDPNLPVERVSFLLKDSSAKLLLTSKSYEKLYESFHKVLFEDINLNSNSAEVTTPQLFQPESRLAYIIYTSGSTGLPKGVGITQESLLNLLQFRQHTPGVDQHDNMLGITTMSFDISEEELYLPLICGARLTIVDDDIAKDGQALLDTLKSENITIMQATPYVWQMMLEAGWEEVLPIKAFCGGEALTKKLADQLLVRCSELWNMYGPTETTICSIVKKLAISDEVITIGKPIAQTKVYILDENLQEVNPGEAGEMFISGIGVSGGYINRPELTAEKFIDDIYSDIPGQKMYRTGDLAQIYKNGDIQFLGRIDHQVKIRGYRIETEEIEHQLKEQEDISDALVMVYKDKVENARLVAYIIPKNRVGFMSADEWTEVLKNSLKKVLPEYMVPLDYLLIDTMPLLPSGKVDRKALPVPEITNHAITYVAPVTELEKIITAIWTETIGIEKIGINDDFFGLGGTSLIALKTKIQIEKATNKRLRPSILFKYPTIKKLAALIAGSTIENFKSLVPIKPEGSKVPLYIVHGIGLNVLNFRELSTNLDKEQPVYGLQAVDADDPENPLGSIEEIAAFYNQEIIKHNPRGPYVIAGYSIGGVIAYEMVKQLKKQGREVKLLIMFDTAIQIPSHQYKLLKKIYIKTRRQFHKLKFRTLSFYKQPKENLDYLIEFYTKLWGKVVYNRIDFYDLPEYMEKTIVKIMKAFDRYKVEPSDVRIDLFVAQKIYFLDDPKTLGWKKYAKHGLTIYPVTGGHDDMFDSSHNQEIAFALQKRLDEIND